MVKAARRFRPLLLLSAAALLTVAPLLTQAPTRAAAATVLYSDNFEGDTIGAPAAGWTIVSGTWVVALDGTQVPILTWLWTA